MSKYKARKDLQIGDDVYAPGDIISDPPDIVGSWVLWGDVELVEEDADLHSVAEQRAAGVDPEDTVTLAEQRAGEDAPKLPAKKAVAKKAKS